jgi:CO/xanthine dehydrogenase FAD-binding subunit
VTVREYLVPASVPEAVGLLAEHGRDVVVMAGGTVVMSLMNDGVVLQERVMSIRGMGLDRIDTDGEVVRIGAAVTLSQALDDDRIPLLSTAIRATGSWPVRNRGTVAGNLFTMPRGGDVAVALLALGARVRLASSRGERDMSLRDFYAGPTTTDLAPDELVTAIDVPLEPLETSFMKFGRKRANTPAVVTVAVALRRAPGVVEEARIALGAVGPRPVRATDAEGILAGSSLTPDAVTSAAQAATAACEPATDAIATAWYRARMIPVIVGRALDQLRTGGER